ncbi:MAG: response regulator [Myxococcota bacterium]
MTRRVLVVDDDPTIVKMVKRLLASEGYEVTTAESPLGVSSLVRRIDPEVIILDVMMPGLSGESLAKLIKKVAERRPLIFYSAMAEDELLALTRRVPDSTYVAKGSPLAELVTTVDRMMRLYASQRP